MLKSKMTDMSDEVLVIVRVVSNEAASRWTNREPNPSSIFRKVFSICGLSRNSFSSNTIDLVTGLAGR